MNNCQQDNTYTFRKIRKEDVKKAAEALTEAFIDYPQFRRMYQCKNQKRYRRKVYVTFLFWIYTLTDSFYVNDTIDCVVCLEKPGDKNPSGITGLLPHLGMLLRGIFYDYSIPDFKLMSDYLKFSDKYGKRHIQNGDYYLHFICTVGKARHSRIIFKFFLEHDDGKPIFLETHTEDNVCLYCRMGFEVLEKADWYGVPHYLMRRPNDADFDYRLALNEINRIDEPNGLSM